MIKSCVYPEGCTYPDVGIPILILMYLKRMSYLTSCSVTFQENTCILTFCMYFTRIPKESKIHLGYTSLDTSDTSRFSPYMYLGRFLGVTLDNISGYIRIRVSWTPCGIHAGYMGDTRGTRISGFWGYIICIRARPQVNKYMYGSRYVS